MDELTRMVIATAMHKMFNGGHFSICSVDVCLKIAGIIPPRRPYELLHALHCVDFKAMPRELLEKVPDLLTECFGGVRIDELMRLAVPAGAISGGADKRRLN